MGGEAAANGSWPRVPSAEAAEKVNCHQLGSADSFLESLTSSASAFSIDFISVSLYRRSRTVHTHLVPVDGGFR